MLLYAMLATGLPVLVLGAALLVNGASSLARKLGIDEFVVGNVLGSNTFNILVILGGLAGARAE